jgi:cellulose synthase/poly-beta-1,6-N-acetylglucosamine synthase-like glycosyltransferase
VLSLFVAATVALVLIWFGYPFVIAMLAALKQGRRRAVKAASGPGAARPTVTVVIATTDAFDVIAARVRNVLAGDYAEGGFDVVVGLDVNSPVVPAHVEAIDPRVRVVRGDAPGGKATTLNAAVREARGEIVVFTDTAQRFEADTITRLVEALADGSLGAVSGALQIGHDGVPATMAERYWLFEKWLREREAAVHSTVGVTGAVYALRRALFTPLPAGLILDDVYTPMRVVLRGFRVGFEPRARAVDERRFPPGQEFRRKARTLTGVVQLCAWLPQVLVPWRNPIWAQFLFHKLLRLATPYLAVLAAAGLVGWSWQRLEARVPGAAVPVLLLMVTAIGAAVLASAALRRTLHMAVAMQAAVVRATVNGLRGQWDVWSR